MVFVKRPRRERLRRNKHIGLFVIAITDPSELLADVVVVRGANTTLATEIAVPLFPIRNAIDHFVFVAASNHFSHNVVVVEKCVMRHQKTTLPVPAVKV